VKPLLGDGVDLWDLVGIEECICGAAEGCADVESEHKFSGGATIGCAVHREIATVLIAHKPEDLRIFLGTRHTFGVKVNCRASSHVRASGTF